MAYDASKEERKVLATFDKNTRGDKIQVASITIKGKEGMSVDIRNMYTAEDGEMRPTQKGVRVNVEMVADIIKAVLPLLTEDEATDILNALSIQLSDEGTDDTFTTEE